MRGSPKRQHVNKQKSANSFKHQVGRTRLPNVAPAPMRGGIRL